MKDYYDILEVHPDASKEQIKVAYRKLVKEYHPDKNKDNNPVDERIKDINEAKHILLHTTRRVEYDLLLSNYKLATIFNQVPKEDVKQEVSVRPIHSHFIFNKSFAFVAAFGILLLVLFNLVPENENNLEMAVTKLTSIPSSNESSSTESSPEVRTIAYTTRREGNVATAQPNKPASPETRELEPAVTKAFANIREKAIDKSSAKVPSVKQMISEVELSEQQMQETLSKIRAAKANYNSQTNCIQVIKTNTSNVTNAFTIATYLKNNGYIITGREIANNTQEGINIKTSGSCIRVIIGTL